MIDIFEKRKELDAQKSDMTGGEYSSRKCLKLREWDILSTTLSLLREVGEMSPRYAIEREGPDFATYWDDDSSGPGIEITEVLHPDFRRGDFWREAEQPDAPTYFDIEAELEEPWLPLRKAVTAKAGKCYPAGTWLLVYFNIGRFSFPDWSEPLDRLLLAEHSSTPFAHLDSFGRVLVLSANMESLVELFPVTKALKPDNWAP